MGLTVSVSLTKMLKLIEKRGIDIGDYNALKEYISSLIWKDLSTTELKERFKQTSEEVPKPDIKPNILPVPEPQAKKREEPDENEDF